MKSKILGLLAVGLLAGPISANATPLSFAFTDGTNNVSFQMDSNPSPFENVGEQGVGISVGPVSVNGAIFNGGIAGFFLSAFEGGIQLQAAGIGLILEQSGAQLFSGSYPSPVFAPGIFSLTDYSSDATYNSNFRLTISTVSVPEPGTLALLGLGLAGLGLSRRRKAN